MSETFLQMKHITKRFPGVLALNDVQFSLRRGEVHALLGENGAGKSTLMKILSGVYQPDEGEIIFEDKPVSFSDPLSAQNVGITIIHQEFNLFPELTVEENIFIGREFCKKNRWRLDEKQQRQATIEILQKLNLAIKPDTLVADLTVAQQQMVEIAKAISVNARILIMDEPTAALTETEIESLFRVTRLLKEQGTGIVYISHRLEELALIADRATVMRDGQYISTVDYECVKISDLIAMMVGRDLGNIYPRREALQQRIPVLEVNGLTRKGVLNDINFTLYRGEILGFAGLMGAGRTELARAIFGADSIDSGTLKLNGKETVIKDISDAIQQGISYLTEDRKKEGLALNLSVERNIMLGNYPEYSDRFGNVDSRRCQQTSEEQVKALRIKTPNLEQAALNLSGGNQQKIIIARWVCKDTDILIFDEPTRGIDVGAKLEIYELMNRLVAKGKSIIMISSELPEVLGMCDRILVMRSGRITGELSAKEATQEKIMQYKIKINKELLMRLAPLFSLIILVLFFSFSSPFFFNTENIMTIALQTSVIGIMAIGVTFVIITAGIDLSLGSVVAFSGVAVGICATLGLPLPVCIIAGVLAGGMCGYVNGLLVTKMTIPPFIATLGLMMSVRGINMVMTDGRAIYFADYPMFKTLAQGRLFDVLPYPVFYLVIVALVGAYILKKTVIGRYVYAVGSNEVAAHLSGIKVQRVKIFVYAFCGLLTGIAGVILASRLNSGQPTVGVGYELEAIAAVVIGGTSLMGGIGTIGGTIIGAFIMSVLKNGLNLMGVSQFWQMVAMGVVVVAAVYLDTLRKKIR
ncbi:hypothetical protein CRE_26900 [Caenorhabditis remanei]|uniref:ABC transporter domain-containing protein n=53 Tax=cellular organisms TaxID=131567 RepID=E3NSN8_CAERE|nr:hypothetical protein CRE_26900 [Caenorhabditis remanei]